MELTISYLITAISSIFIWFIGNKHLYPIIINWWNKYQDKKIRNKSDLNAIEEATSNIYANQISFLNSQLDILQNIITHKTMELQKLYDELSKMRKRVANIENELLDTKENNIYYLNHCCLRKDCSKRLQCNEVKEQINDYLIEEETI